MTASGRFLPVVTVREFSSSARCYADSTGRVRPDVAVRTKPLPTYCAANLNKAGPDCRDRQQSAVAARMAPDNDPAYRHDLEGPDDMAAHARSVLTSTGLSVPIGGGWLLLGTW